MDSKSRPVNAQNVQKLKIILLGDYGVGKSSLINQYVHQKFQKGQVLDFQKPLLKEQEVQNEVESQQVTLQIYDTGGRERQEAGGLEAAFFSDAKGCILVYDVHNQSSMDNLRNWHNMFITRVTSNRSEAKSFPFIVIGNKADPDGVKSNELHNETATTWCAMKDIKHFLTSAKDNRSVIEAFQHVAGLALQYNKQDPRQKPPNVPANGAPPGTKPLPTSSSNDPQGTPGSNPPIPPKKTAIDSPHPGAKKPKCSWCKIL